MIAYAPAASEALGLEDDQVHTRSRATPCTLPAHATSASGVGESNTADATSPYEHGFLTRITDNPIEAAFETATAIAARNPEAIRGTKRLFNEPADRFVADTLMLESVLQDDIIGYPNQIEAVKAELEGRAPVYTDRAAGKKAAE